MKSVILDECKNGYILKLWNHGETQWDKFVYLPSKVTSDLISELLRYLGERYTEDKNA